MIGFLENVSWRESMVLVMVVALFFGLRLRRALHGR